MKRLVLSAALVALTTTVVEAAPCIKEGQTATLVADGTVRIGEKNQSYFTNLAVAKVAASEIASRTGYEPVVCQIRSLSGEVVGYLPKAYRH